LNARFGDLVVDVGHGTALFEPRRAAISYVRQDYLLRPGIVEALSTLRQILSNLTTTPPDAAAAIVPGTRRTEANGLQIDLLAAQGERALTYLAEHLPSNGATAPPELCLDARFGAQAEVQHGMILGDGWSGPETDFRWTSGHRSVLYFTPPRKSGSYTLLLVVAPFVAPPTLKVQRVTVSINGKSAGYAEVSAFSILQCHLPWSLLEAPDVVVVEFALPDAVRPSAILDTLDQRELALNFRRVALLGPLVTGSRP
jgi:hypothetical protein